MPNKLEAILYEQQQEAINASRLQAEEASKNASLGKDWVYQPDQKNKRRAESYKLLLPEYNKVSSMVDQVMETFVTLLRKGGDNYTLRKPHYVIDGMNFTYDRIDAAQAEWIVDHSVEKSDGGFSWANPYSSGTSWTERGEVFLITLNANHTNVLHCVNRRTKEEFKWFKSKIYCVAPIDCNITEDDLANTLYELYTNPRWVPETK